jgi:23S rRNA G2445 N2-methylase RlmL
MALNLHSRIASRVLLQMAQAPYRQEDDLYKLAGGLALGRLGLSSATNTQGRCHRTSFTVKEF